jgi:hypothetical protein
VTAVLALNAALIAANVLLLALALGHRFGLAAGDRFWITLRVAQTIAVAGVVAVGVLYELGHHAEHRLFYLYSVLPVVINLLGEELRSQSLRAVLDEFRVNGSEGLRSLPNERRTAVQAAAMRRQADITAVVALVIVFLALRAITTSAGV